MMRRIPIRQILFFCLIFAGFEMKVQASSFYSEQNIVGGTTVTDRSSFEYKHTARLLVSAVTAGTKLPDNMRGIRVNWRCSASILNKRNLLSAAHCFPKTMGLKDSASDKIYFAELNNMKVEAFFRLDSRIDLTTGIRSKQVIVHEGFRDDWTNRVVDIWNPEEPIHDIAIVKLESDVPSDKEPVALLQAQDEVLKQGENLVMAGYGRDLSEAQVAIPRLRRVNVPLRDSLRNGMEWYVGAGDIQKAGKVDRPAGGCYGDSGGPVYAVRGTQARVVGVVVRGPSESNGGCSASVTIATAVPEYVDWITKNSKD